MLRKVFLPAPILSLPGLVRRGLWLAAQRTG
jgi:hypothetical protein